MNKSVARLSRREAIAGLGGLVVAASLPRSAIAADTSSVASDPIDATAYVRVAPDNSVTVVVKHIEWGQGVNTGLSTLVAEELDADWSQMRAVSAPVSPALYGNKLFGGIQATAGSTSLADSYLLMRRAGATARAMLIEAAARTWQVKASEIRVSKGVLSHPASARSGSFGDFAAIAAKLPTPANVSLKDPSTFKLIGSRAPLRRLDTPDKTNGKATYALDISEPGLLTVLVLHPPRFGAKPASFDASMALRVQGVVAVKQISSGFAVYAKGMWAALKGRDAIKPVWDESAAEGRGSDQIIAEYREIAKTAGTVVAIRGDPEKELRAAGELVEATYILPYLAHAPMEPLDGYIRWDGDSVTARYGCPIQSLDQEAIAGVLGVPPDKVSIEMMMAGGSFGRRGPANLHFGIELAECAKAIGPHQAIKLVWTREDDIRGGCYRPLTLHHMRAALTDGRITGWTSSIVGQSLWSGTAIEQVFEKNGVDPYMIEGVSDMIYRVDHFRCEAHKRMSPVTTTPWRSTGYSHTIYAVECFVDALLEKTGKDPVDGRLELLGNKPRGEAVLRAVAKLANWDGNQVKNGRARGVALFLGYESTWVAQIAEVSLDAEGHPKVHKIWCAVDCGVVVNPDVVLAQVEGGIGWGVGHALYGEIPIEAGAPTVSNFDGFRALRMNEMPNVEVVVMPSDQPPSGIGELSVPCAGPAIANALARLGRERPSQLPMVRA